MPEPSPFEQVTAQAQPSTSSTEMCVVEPSREAKNRSAKPGIASPSRKSGVRSALARAIASTMCSSCGGGGWRSSSDSA